jgi:mannosyltransferase PIG-V
MADSACILLVMAAAIVAMAGGFRLRLGSWRIGVTSPYPLVAWAAIVGVVRHVAVPHRPIYADFPQRVAAWWRVPTVRAAATVVAGTRPVILLVGYLAVLTVGFAGGRAPLRYFDNELLNLPVRWDASWYLEIANQGYRFVPDRPELQQNIVFLPAYPMLVRTAGRLFGHQMTGFTVAGVFVSVAAFFGALIYLYEIARRWVDQDAALFALWLIAAYPFAVFFGAIYTESLFLLGTTGAFYHFSKQEFGRAALWGVIVGLTRPNGVLLVLPLAIAAVSAGNVAPGAPAGSAPGRSPRVRALAAAAMPAGGALLYSAFVWSLTGDPFAWLKGQAAWGRTYGGFEELLRHQYEYISNVGLSGYLATPGYEALNAFAAVFAIAMVWPVFRRLGAVYAVFILLNILPPLAAGGLLSAGRLSSVLFPMFIWLASAIPPHHRAAWIATSAALQALSAVLFYTWRPLF